MSDPVIRNFEKADRERLREIAALKKVIAKQRNLLVAAHEALVGEVAVYSRRPGPRALACKTLERLTEFLVTEKKADAPAKQPCPVCGGEVVTNTVGCSAACDAILAAKKR